ncbi:MAG: hypothetical protein KJ721_00080 [Nanoarchaeota archaeon]|nr:hypothetical protein [Nanoarchaeota archaeon]
MVDKKEILIIGTFIFSIVILSMFFVLAAVAAPTGLIINQNVTPLYDEGNFTVNWTAGGVDQANFTIYIYADGVLYTTDTNDSISGYSFSNTTEANYTFTIGAVNETLDQLNSTNISMYIDTTAPSILVTNYTNATTKKNTDQLTLNINVTDALSGETGSQCLIDVNGTNQTVVVTGNWCNSSSINLTNLDDGYHIINIWVNDTVNNLGLNNSFFVLIDTTSPTASFGTNPINNYNSSSADVVFDLKCADGYSANDLVLYGNWTSSGWHANQTNASSVNNTFWNITVSGIVDGTYVWGVYCNDSAGNSNWSITNRTVTIDTTSPSASPACTPSTVETSETVTCTCGGSDSGSGINSGATSASSTPSTVNSGTFTYGCSVADYAGNTASASATYIVEGQSSSGSSSSGGATSTFSYSKTIPQTAQEFKDIKKIETSSFSGGGLRAKERVKIKFNDEEHFVGIRELTETSATIEIASDPVQVKLDVGEDAKVDFDEDGYYDIYVKLNKIISGKADITIEYLNEIIPEEKGSVETTGEDVTPREEIEKESEPGGKNYTWLWILIIVLVIVVGAGIKYKKK